jgi:REP element-mobilizing transposase RayT
MSAYGFWLPNDPRGSWSKYVGSADLMKFGRATKVETHRSVAHVKHDISKRQSAKQELKSPPVQFTSQQAMSIARGFSTAVDEAEYIVYACCILPQHVHLVIEQHARPIRRIAGHLKARSTRQLRDDGLYTFGAESPWASGCWAVFLNSPEAITRSIRYVERNPQKEGKRKQTWKFVSAYPG